MLTPNRDPFGNRKNCKRSRREERERERNNRKREIWVRNKWIVSDEREAEIKPLGLEKIGNARLFFGFFFLLSW